MRYYLKTGIHVRSYTLPNFTTIWASEKYIQDIGVDAQPFINTDDELCLVFESEEELFRTKLIYDKKKLYDIIRFASVEY